jgi:hypothetical protein
MASDSLPVPWQRIAYRRAIAVLDRTCPQHGCLPLARGEQYGRLQRRVRSGAAERNRTRGAALVVRELDDADAIEFAESEEELMHTATERLDRLPQFRWAVLRRLHHRLDSRVFVLPLK